MQGTQIDNFNIKNFSSTKADLDRIDETFKFFEIWVWISKRILIRTFSLDISDYQDTDAREKSNDF